MVTLFTIIPVYVIQMGISFHVYGCFTCIPLMCLVPMEASRGYCTSWNWSYIGVTDSWKPLCGCWELNLEVLCKNNWGSCRTISLVPG